MIIINTGIPKSGTTLFFNYRMDFIRTAFGTCGIEAWRDRNKGSFYIPAFSDEMLFSMLDIHSKYGSFVIKTHLPPDKYSRKLVEDHGAKVTCCYRDPRDIILSAIDHGNRTRKGLDESGAFGDIFNVADGIRNVIAWVNIYFGWLDYGHALILQYEDFIPDQAAVLQRMNDFLGLGFNHRILYQLLFDHDLKKTSRKNFNKGTCYRWKTEMDPEDIRLCNDRLHDIILEMGYQL